MPETEFVPRSRDSYREYSVPRTHLEMAVLLEDLRAHPGEWAVYLKCRSFPAATNAMYNLLRKERTLSIKKKYPNNIELATAYHPDEGAMVVIRWVN